MVASLGHVLQNVRQLGDIEDFAARTTAKMAMRDFGEVKPCIFSLNLQHFYSTGIGESLESVIHCGERHRRVLVFQCVIDIISSWVNIVQHQKLQYCNSLMRLSQTCFFEHFHNFFHRIFF